MHDLPNFDYLLIKTKTVLEQLVRDAPFLKNYVLVGGSALALYLCHRQSEDLDFFTYDNTFNKQAIFDILKYFTQADIINDNKDQIDLILDGVKVTFFNAQWEFLTPVQTNTLNIASLENIAAMKVNTLFLRAKYRDYYDLYSLSKAGMDLQEMFIAAQKVIEGINFKLFCIALLYIDDVEDDNIAYLSPKEIISKKQIRTFFEKQMQG